MQSGMGIGRSYYLQAVNLTGGIVWGSDNPTKLSIVVQVDWPCREILHNTFPTVTSVSLASGQLFGAVGGSGLPMEVLCGLFLPHHLGQQL